MQVFYISDTVFFPVSAANTEDKAGLNCPEFSRKTRENTLREFRTFRDSRQGLVQAQALALCSRKKQPSALFHPGNKAVWLQISVFKLL